MPINDIIKNKYIVCKSPEHGKKIVEFFVANGAVNNYNHIGSAVYMAYFVDRTGLNSAWIEYFKETKYTEMQLPEEFTPKRGDVVLTDSDILELRRIRNYFGEHDVTGFEHMAFSVLDGIVKRAEPIKQTITKAEGFVWRNQK